ncbi:MAG: hypothetical protein U1E46_13805 [Hyphomicrobiales bacterium]
MAAYQFELLGGLRTSGPRLDVLTRKSRAVAAYLALQNGVPQTREKVLGLFWERSSDEQARASLRQCLAILRKAFGPNLIAEGDAISLRTDEVSTDAREFQQLIASDDRTELEAAVELYHGDLLDGFDFKEDAFEAWALVERERFRSLLAQGLTKLISNAQRANDLSAVLKFGLRSLPTNPSIIVLPLKNLNVDGRFGHLAEGIRIDIQMALVKMSGIFVIAAGNAATYANRSCMPQDVTAEMGVRYVLEGTLQSEDSRVRIATQLIDGLSGRIVWAERLEAVLGSEFDFQDEIVRKVVTALDVTLVAGEQARVWRKTLRKPDALNAYYQGLECLRTFDKQNVQKARTSFERVCTISPDVALGPTMVAFCFYWEARLGWSGNTERAIEHAESWALKAAKLDDVDGQAHAILGHVNLIHRRWAEAWKFAQESLELRPRCANTNALAGTVFLYCGDSAKALELPFPQPGVEGKFSRCRRANPWGKLEFVNHSLTPNFSQNTCSPLDVRSIARVPVRGATAAPANTPLLSAC